MDYKDSDLSLAKKAAFALASLSVYRRLKKAPAISSFNRLVKHIGTPGFDLLEAAELYSDVYFSLMSSGRYSCFKEYIIEGIIFDDNPFSAMSEKQSFEEMDREVLRAAANDLDTLQMISAVSCGDIRKLLLKSSALSAFETEAIEALPIWNSACSEPVYKDRPYLQHIPPLMDALYSSESWSKCLERLCSFHYKYGRGDVCRYSAFVWDSSGSTGGLRGIESPDPVRLSDLIDYEEERSEIIDNTVNFLKGYPANNVLLYGDRGTGKSSSVKAILNEYHNLGLRLVEIPKNALIDFPRIMGMLQRRMQKFIIFIDDLSFEDSEESYTALKAALEGGVESRPHNVLIYATSNRRHLIKEKFSDRHALHSLNHDDEVRASDSIQEKLSLADRFGITVVFSSPDKYKFLNIVEGLVQKRGIVVDKEYLHKEALKWELWYNGRSPRTAKQFVDWLEGMQKNRESSL